jgi:hypothetical protein
MLIITLHNDGTGDLHYGNYDYEVFVNQKKISSGRVENHNRKIGWEALVKDLAAQLAINPQQTYRNGNPD